MPKYGNELVFPVNSHSAENGEIVHGRKPLNKGGALQAVTEEVVGSDVLLSRSPFVCDILRKLLLRVSPVRSTSADLRC